MGKEHKRKTQAGPWLNGCGSTMTRSPPLGVRVELALPYRLRKGSEPGLLLRLKPAAVELVDASVGMTAARLKAAVSAGSGQPADVLGEVRSRKAIRACRRAATDGRADAGRRGAGPARLGLSKLAPARSHPHRALMEPRTSAYGPRRCAARATSREHRQGRCLAGSSAPTAPRSARARRGRIARRRARARISDGRRFLSASLSAPALKRQNARDTGAFGIPLRGFEARRSAAFSGDLQRLRGSGCAQARSGALI